MAQRREDERERKKIFRRMEMFFVWLPVLLLLLVTIFGSAFVAWIIPLGGSYVQRWIWISVIVLGGTGILYSAHHWWTNRK